MPTALHTLALQNVPQEKGGGLGVSIEIVAATILACALLTATILLLTRFRRKRDPMFFRESHAREQMQELCPNGWTARIVLYGDGAPLPDDAPPAGDRKVCVEWTEYEPDPTGHVEVAVARRMWSRTITGALRGMLADRQLDRELEKIEQRVIHDAGEGGGTGPAASGSHGRPGR
jgi:hypothetical protein